MDKNDHFGTYIIQKFIVKSEDTQEQIETAQELLKLVEEYIKLGTGKSGQK